MALPSFYHWNGLIMESIDTSSLFIDPYAMWGIDSNNIWLCGSGVNNQVVKYNGATFTIILNSTDQSWFGVPRVMFGINANDIWVAGEQFIAHWDGATWSQIADPISEVPVSWYGIFGFVSNAIYICGYGTKDYMAYNRYILYWNGSTLTQVYRETSVAYTAFHNIRKIRT